MKRATILTLLVIATLETFSQKNDTICVNRADLIYKLKQVERLKVDSIERDAFRGQIVQLNDIVKTRGEIISTQDARITNYELQKSNYQATVNLQTETIKSLNKALKKEKSKRAFTTGAGAFLVMGLTYLLITK